MSPVFGFPAQSGTNVFSCGRSSAVKAGSLSVGDTFYIPVTIDNAIEKYPFIVVHKGKPSSLYDDSCDGVWIMSVNVWDDTATFNTADYSTSGVAGAMPSLLAKMDGSIQLAAKQVKIPYAYYVSGTGMVVKSGADGFSCKAFPLAVNEMGYTTIGAEADGAKLDYFTSVTDTQTQAIGELNGEAVPWYTRSAHMTGGGTRVGYRVTASGGCVGNANTAYNLRPALIVSHNYPIRKSWFNA